MKNLVIVFILLCSWFNLKAQIKPIYFIGDSVVTDKAKASYYGVTGKLEGENIYVLKMYDLYDNLLQTGFYKDERLTIPHGRFSIYANVEDFNDENWTTFYIKDKERFLAEQGDYNDGKKVGRWVSFFPDGKIFAITNYIAGLKHGEYKVFNRIGKIVTNGSYNLDVKNGEWTYYRKGKETYNNGILTSREEN